MLHLVTRSGIGSSRQFGFGEVDRVLSCFLARFLVEVEHRTENSCARSVVSLFEYLGVKEKDSCGEEMHLTKVDELQHDSLRASLQVKVNYDLFQGLCFRRVLIVFDDMILDDLVRQLPILQAASHDEWL